MRVVVFTTTVRAVEQILTNLATNSQPLTLQIAAEGLAALQYQWQTNAGEHHRLPRAPPTRLATCNRAPKEPTA